MAKVLCRSGLPYEITMFHILPRLPGKSILRFMCVSKQWRDFLRTPIFKNMHLLHHINELNSHKLLLVSDKADFYTMNCEAPEYGLTACRAPLFETRHSTVHVLSSFHGLVCVGIKTMWTSDIEYSYLIFWNPLTREHITLPKPDNNYHRECYKIHRGTFSLYYTSSNDDYKLLRVLDDNDVYIYSLKSNSWRKLVTSSLERTYILQAWMPSIWLNEKLYFLRIIEIHSTLSCPPSYLISRFDTKTEKLIEIATPPCFKNDDRLSSIWSFSLLRGCIHLGVGYYDYERHNSMEEIDMWRMDVDGGWMKVLTYLNIPLLPWFEEPLHMMRTGHWIMHSRRKGYFSKVDMLENNTKDSMKIIPFPRGMHTGIKLLKVNFIETFVSPIKRSS